MAHIDVTALERFVSCDAGDTFAQVAQLGAYRTPTLPNDWQRHWFPLLTPLLLHIAPIPLTATSPHLHSSSTGTKIVCACKTMALV